jgi:hypothetical protein
LLQALAKHEADVLSLAASPSHRAVYAAGADGQVDDGRFYRYIVAANVFCVI